MNPSTILTEVAEQGPDVLEAVEETTQTFIGMLNSNSGVVGFAVGCLVLVLAVVGIYLATKKQSKKRK